MTFKIERMKERHCDFCFRYEPKGLMYIRVGNCVDYPVITNCICEDCYKELIGKMTQTKE